MAEVDREESTLKDITTEDMMCRSFVRLCELYSEIGEQLKIVGAMIGKYQEENHEREKANGN